MMPSSRRIAPHLLSALLLSIAVVVTAAASPVAAGSGSRKACKLLKPKQIEKVLGAEAQRSKVEGTQVAGAESCAFDVGPGRGEPGGPMPRRTSLGDIAASMPSDMTAPD
jgi:hypothetical protein